MTKKQVAKILAPLGPVAKGSLVEVRKPCIRAHCRACREGRRHRAFMFHYADAGKRRCMYVPLALVGVLRKALAAGRLVEKCLHEAGPALIRAGRRKAGRSA